MKDSDHPSASAEVLTFISDSYSEQKCNTDWAMACTLIAEGWYKEVQFFYGVVGHTHNGIDARHRILNQDTRRTNVATPVHLRHEIDRRFMHVEDAPDVHPRPPAGLRQHLRHPLNVFEKLAGFSH
jgi:hypothetical protein